MDGVKQREFARKSEMLEKRQALTLRKQTREYRQEIDRIKNKHRTDIATLNKDYNSQAIAEKNQLENKLIELRNKNDEILKNEDQRYKKIVEELKMAHADQVAELKTNQEKEIEQQKNEHQEYLENAALKFETQKVKYES